MDEENEIIKFLSKNSFFECLKAETTEKELMEDLGIDEEDAKDTIEELKNVSIIDYVCMYVFPTINREIIEKLYKEYADKNYDFYNSICRS